MYSTQQMCSLCTYIYGFNYYDQKVEHKNPADAYKSKIVHVYD